MQTLTIFTNPEGNKPGLLYYKKASGDQEML